MLICKNIIKVHATILVKIKYIKPSSWMLWIFGPLGIISLKTNNFFLSSTWNQLQLLYLKSRKSLWFSSIPSENSIYKELFFGLHKGFLIKLGIKGVGYKLSCTQNKLFFLLGFSHVVDLNLPKEIQILSSKKKIILWSCNLQKLMEFVRIIYLLRKPDAYKGKGLIPSTITLRLKEGKKSKK